jgi:hypothetical protein
MAYGSKVCIFTRVLAFLVLSSEFMALMAKNKSSEKLNVHI